MVVMIGVYDEVRETLQEVPPGAIPTNRPALGKIGKGLD
jgi:hypothetical protein